jgi:hypothetical protein
VARFIDFLCRLLLQLTIASMNDNAMLRRYTCTHLDVQDWIEHTPAVVDRRMAKSVPVKLGMIALTPWPETSVSSHVLSTRRPSASRHRAPSTAACTARPWHACSETTAHRLDSIGFQSAEARDPPELAAPCCDVCTLKERDRCKLFPGFSSADACKPVKNGSGIHLPLADANAF